MRNRYMSAGITNAPPVPVMPTRTPITAPTRTCNRMLMCANPSEEMPTIAGNCSEVVLDGGIGLYLADITGQGEQDRWYRRKPTAASSQNAHGEPYGALRRAIRPRDDLRAHPSQNVSL